MRHKVIIVDTCLLRVWLNMPGDTKTGNKGLTREAIEKHIVDAQKRGATAMLTVACIIETGNHITQIKNGNVRRAVVWEFAQFIEDVASGNRDDWMIYSQEKDMWTPEKIARLARQWKAHNDYSLSMGDTSILEVATQLKSTFDVEVYTDDESLETLSQLPPQRRYAPASRRNP